MQHKNQLTFCFITVPSRVNDDVKNDNFVIVFVISTGLTASKANHDQFILGLLLGQDGAMSGNGGRKCVAFQFTPLQIAQIQDPDVFGLQGTENHEMVARVTC